MVRGTRARTRASTSDVYENEEDTSHTMIEDQGHSEADSTIRILIASDNHIGYAERDPVRGQDSYNSFREVMELAKSEDVDMVLLAGDLFHENKPSRQSMFQAMRSLRLNCLGDKPCELEVLGDQSVATEDTAVMHINYEDADINVAIPVFSIHGNHDDPSGEGRLCALDILQVAGLLNYYGRVPESDDITVKPVLLRKGTTKLALYGLSNVRDERLHRSFRHNKVKFMRPELYQDEWFNLIAVHQNHHGHSETNYLPENFIQNFFDFVVWGHEHECMIDPALNPEQDFHVCQPGSSVATSLCAGEAVPKHVGVLSIRDRDFKMRKIPLKTVRPFVMKELTLSDFDELDPKQKNKADVIALLMEKVEDAILEANEQWREVQDEADKDHDPPLPLVRLRVEYSSAVGSYELENPQRFSQRFLGRVANASDVIQFHTKKKAPVRKSKAAVLDRPDLSDVRLENLKVSVLVKQYLATQSLQCLPENELGDAVTQFVDKDDKDAVKDFVTDHLRKQLKMMTANKTSESNLNEAMRNSKDALAGQFQARQQELEAQRRRRQETQVSDFEGEDDFQGAAKQSTTKRKPATKSKAQSPVNKKRASTRKRKQAESSEEEDEEEEDDHVSDVEEESEPEPAPKSRTKAATKPRGGSTRKPAGKPATTRQSQLTFTSTPAAKREKLTQQESISISSEDEDDGFQPPPPPKRRR